MLKVFDAQFARNPWPVLDSLRADGGVHRVVTPDGPPAWLVTRYGDVRAGLLDDRLTPHPRYARGNDYRGFAVPKPLDTFQSAEPDQLARLRRAVTSELQPRRLGRWNERTAAITEPLLEKLDEADTFDLVEELAVPLPAAVLTELLGLSEPTHDRLLDWAHSTLRANAAPRARDTLATMQEIIADAVEQGRRAEDRTMLGRLTTAGFDSGELVGLLFYLLFVWYEVLADLISGAVTAFSDRPEQLAAMLSATDPTAPIDELLRFLSPQVLAGPRFATTDLDIGGYWILAGDTVLFCLASANHDPERFTAPDELDVRRTPNPHLALGYGGRACVGTGLVRPVVAAILRRLYERWPALRVVGDVHEIPWRSGFRHRGPLLLPVEPG
ncbi:cytochrome P450 [Nocardia terpenica]|uniref:Cytochrome P450 n=1 Tax=Nocardia terpenica TaxID=455432 RepID=A0A6G9Z5C4_9NOCA|nr:cytochrome P450 [Nocardia terpenica]QIS20682.1 cytochrome P450 [Nocardia terpenica]